MLQAIWLCCMGSEHSSETDPIAKRAAGPPVRAAASAGNNGQASRTSQTPQASSSQPSTQSNAKGASNAAAASGPSNAKVGSKPGPSATPSFAERLKTPNYLFYQNKLASSPNPSGTVERIHRDWFGDYALLEFHHGYIQVRFSCLMRLYLQFLTTALKIGGVLTRQLSKSGSSLFSSPAACRSTLVDWRRKKPSS